MTVRTVSRRSFLKTSAFVAGAPMIMPARAYAGANEKLDIAVVGTQNQAGWNIGQLAEHNIVALCDVDSNYLARAGEQFPSAHLYRDYRVMLQKERGADAVLVATPDHIHGPASAMAMRLGKHVYCEKPLAHSVYETRMLARLAAEHGLATQMGTQIHAGGNYRRVVELIRAGAIGPVREAHVWCGKSWSNGRFGLPVEPPAHLDWDLWLGPAPLRAYSGGLHPANWRRFWDYGTGTLGDMACHYMDLVHWALDLTYPTRVRALGPRVHEVGTPSSLVVHYDHPPRDHPPRDHPPRDHPPRDHAARGKQPPVRVSWYDGENRPSILSALRNADGTRLAWGDGQLFVGDDGMLISNYGGHQLLPVEKFEGFQPPAPSIPDSIGHHKEWFEACMTGSPTTCNFAYSGALTEAVLLGNVAFRTGETLEWDAANLCATNAPSVEALIRPEFRAGWEV